MQQMMRVRRGIDGSYYLPRSCPETEAYLDSKYVRVKNELRWVNLIPDMMNYFLNSHKGAICAIIGKGPSLDNLKAEHLNDCQVIIAINESIHKIESLHPSQVLYGTQLDHSLQETCKPLNMSTKLFIGPSCVNLYDEGVTKIAVDPMSFGLPDGCISACFAVAIARHMGCLKLEMFGFDGCLRQDYEYAHCIGYASSRGGIPFRFKQHKAIIEDCAKNIPLDWVTIKGDEKLVTNKLT